MRVSTVPFTILHHETQYTLTAFEVDFLILLRLLSVPSDYHRRGSVSTVVAHDTPPSWLMILHRRGSVSTVVAHDTPPSWLGIHRRGS